LLDQKWLHEGDNGIKSTAKFYTEIIFTVKIDSLAWFHFLFSCVDNYFNGLKGRDSLVLCRTCGNMVNYLYKICVDNIFKHYMSILSFLLFEKRDAREWILYSYRKLKIVLFVEENDFVLSYNFESSNLNRELRLFHYVGGLHHLISNEQPRFITE
jgi:hypothetical protein